MTVGDVLDGAFKLLKANLSTILLIEIVFVGPGHIAVAYAQRNVFGNGLAHLFTNPAAYRADTQPQSGGQLATQGLAVLFNLLILPFIAGAVSLIVSASYLGREMKAGAALRATLRRFWALLGAWFLVHLAESLALGAGVAVGILVIALGTAASGAVRVLVILSGVALVLAALPLGVALMGLYVAVAPAIVVEELGPIEGLRRSWRLVRRRLWPVTGIAILAGLMASVVSSILGTAPQLAGYLIGSTYGWLLVAAGSVISNAIGLPIVAIVATLLYFDARIRTEGFDLQVIAADLARGAAAP